MKKILKKKGPFKLVFVSGVCIGVGKSDPNIKDYSEMICNSILPETDEQYEKEKEQILEYMNIICYALNSDYEKRAAAKSILGKTI